jgi:hypothetical protein
MHAIRIICLVALVRAAQRGELAAIRFNAIDKSICVYCLFSSVVFVVREGCSGEALVGEAGQVYNIFVSYFACRALIGNYEGFEEFLSKTAIFIVPVAICMSFEAVSGRSLFTGIGDEYRDGHYRCAGAFRSPITAGTFGATLMPLFVGLWFTQARRTAALVGICAATVIVVCGRSSGPLLSYGAGLLGLFCWRFRTHMKAIRRGFALTIIGLHLYMKAPVWFLMGRISDLIGGGGYHRAEIVDAAVKNFSAWWLVGTRQTSDWVGVELSFGGADLTNQFVVEGVKSGLAAMVLFIWIIVRCFRAVGLAVEKTAEEFPESARMFWALGAALLTSVVNFFSVSYFDQIHVVWWLLLAAIASVTAVAAQGFPVVLDAMPQIAEELQPVQCPSSGQDTR